MNVGNLAFIALLFLLLNTLLASIITLLASTVLHIGQGFEYEAVDYTAREIPSVVNTLLSLFPSNIISHWQNGEVIPILVFAIIIAVAYNTYAKEHPEVKSFKTFVDAANKVVGQAVNWLMNFTPYAVLSLIARAVGKSNIAELLPLIGVLILAYVLCFIQLFGIESILIRLIAKLNPIIFFKGIAPAAVVAFTSQSSVGTIPVTVRQLKEKLGVDEDVAAFTAGLGANLGMPGCAAIWPVLLAVFTINALGIEFGVFHFGFLVVLTLVISLGTVGVPGTATIAATALFTAVGLPVEMIVIFSPISSIVDMARTATNVTGAATAAVLVAETEGLLDHDTYNNKSAKEVG
ncbi:MAG: dicarboxylate/amino acid:cation symporter [Clostridia bacterium]|nr:dicarboxylate/amino acid:cation symporter [Clostridia bacterium]